VEKTPSDGDEEIQKQKHHELDTMIMEEHEEDEEVIEPGEEELEVSV